jgi:hypothetical protein
MENQLSIMLSIIHHIKNIVSKQMPKPLGRWRIETCKNRMNQKIDLSNEDHCGPCGHYALGKIVSNEKKGIQQTSPVFPPKVVVLQSKT